MTDDESPLDRVVRISKPADLLGVLPFRLGFHPTESLVVLCLHGRRRRDRLVMRLDLTDPGHDEEVADQLARRAEHVGASDVLLVVYTAGPDDGSRLPRADLVATLRRRLRRSGIGTVDALLVRGDRWWSYLCTDPDCCCPSGTVRPAALTAAAVRYAAEAVAHGAAVLPDRAALMQSVEPSDHAVAREVRAQAADDADTLATTTLDAGGLPALRALTQARLAELRDRWRRGERPLPALDAAVVAIGLHDKDTRDELMTAILDEDAAELVGLLGELVRLVDDEDAAPMCTVLAWVAHANGDGALAAIAAERALRCEPGYSMAELVLEGMDRMLSPSALRRIAREVRADLQRDQAG